MPLSIQGRPPSEADAIRVLHAAFDAGITLIDTADVYCLDDDDVGHNERMIAKALATWEGDAEAIIVATKGGLTRPEGRWERDARPERLVAACDCTLPIPASRSPRASARSPSCRTRARSCGSASPTSPWRKSRRRGRWSTSSPCRTA
jgi:hypothetical protein